MSLAFFFTFSLLALASAGVVLLITWYRGQAIAGSRHCRACGFDLAGLVNVQLCPECGASLDRPQAIVPKRVRPRWLLAPGLALVLLSVLLGGTATISSGYSLDWYKPVWLLKAEALQGAPKRSAAALKELQRRIRASSLSDAQFTDLAKTAVTLRRSPSATWNRGWSDLLELARAHDKVTDTEWTDYVRYSIVPLDRHRKKLRQGAESTFGITVIGPQLGLWAGPRSQTQIRYGILRGTLGDDKEFFTNKHFGGRTTLSGNGSVATSQQIKIDAPIGKAPMKLTFHFDVFDQSGEKTIGSWDQDFTDEVEIVPADVVLVEARENPSLAPTIRQSLKRQPLERDSSGSILLMMNAGRSPANLAFDVFARIRSGPNAGKLVPIGQISFVQGSDAGYGISSNSDELNDDSVDLIFRPSASAAEKNIDLDWFWTGPEIVFEDVKIERKAP